MPSDGIQTEGPPRFCQRNADNHDHDGDDDDDD